MPPLQVAVHPDEHVLERGHLTEQADVLERARRCRDAVTRVRRLAGRRRCRRTTIDPAVGL